MPTIIVRSNNNGNDVKGAIIRFKRTCDKLGLLKNFREQSHEIKPTTQRRKAKDAARKRLLKKLAKENSDLNAAKKASRNRKRQFDGD